MSKFMLISGGHTGRNSSPYELKLIDEEIVKMTNLVNPNLLFIGLASIYSDSYYKAIKNNFSNLNCTCSYLKKSNIINNPDLTKQKINNADIIYFCGGDTLKLIERLKTYKLDELIKERIKEDVVIAGISAGAIFLCKSGFSDVFIMRNINDKYSFINGLNYLDINICPHYETLRKKQIKESITTDKVFCLEDKTAIKIINNKLEVISIDNKKVYLTYKKNNKVIEKDITNKIIDLGVNNEKE